ncbi:MAG TPA: NAD-dependent epimerase/dehydratase family protein, partial [Pseudomonadales bacterium]|nr:NAD-dependent epimerase/dehydratase family protein [Pseudomonadales bacterium]
MERFINGDWELAAYLVTGGAGFIGSHLVEALSASGHEVTVLDNLSSGDKKNIELLLGTKVNFVEGDIRDKTLLDKLVQNCDGVFHLAALVSVPESIKNPLDSFSVNLQGTLNVFESCKGREQIRIVFASSAAVYGNIEQLPIQEGATGNPLSPYGLHKLMCEKHAELYAKLYNVNSVGLRFFNVFGPRQDPSSPYSGVISIFIDRLVKGTAPVIYGDGGQTRDFVYVADVVQALVKAMDSQKQGFEVFNVGRGEGISINMLFEILRGIVGTKLSAEFEPARNGEIHTSLADISKIGSALGYSA